MYTMDHPDLTVSNFLGNSIGTRSVKVKQPALSPASIQSRVTIGSLSARCRADSDPILHAYWAFLSKMIATEMALRDISQKRTKRNPTPPQ